MAVIIRDVVKKIVPLKLRKRVKKSKIYDNKSLQFQDWYMEGDAIAFNCVYNENKKLFWLYFGFIREPETMEYKFCGMIIRNTGTPKKGTWGRNTFEDNDFEGIIQTLSQDEHTPPDARKLISYFKLKKYSIGGILTLCQYRIFGEFIGQAKKRINYEKI